MTSQTKMLQAIMDGQKALEERLTDKIDKVDEKVDGLNRKVDKGFESVNTRLNKIWKIGCFS